MLAADGGAGREVVVLGYSTGQCCGIDSALCGVNAGVYIVDVGDLVFLKAVSIVSAVLFLTF